MIMQRISHRMVAIIGAAIILASAATGLRAYQMHRQAMADAAAAQALDRLTTPAPRRAGVSLRPGR